MKQFARLYLPVVLAICLVTALVGVALTRSDLDKLEEAQIGQMTLAREIVASLLLLPFNQLEGMSREPDLREALRLSPEVPPDTVEAHLASLLYRNPFYDQVRWLDRDGKELMRVTQGEEHPFAVGRRELGDHARSPWFRAMAAQPPGSTYMSAFDLSTEGTPPGSAPQPVVRFGIRLPIEGGRDLGSLVVNLHAQDLLDRLRSIKRRNIGESVLLLNAQGYWLLTPVAGDAFGFATGAPEKSFARRHPAEWTRISSAQSGQMLLPSGLWTWETIDPADLFRGDAATGDVWKVATHIPAATIAGMVWNRWWPLLLVTATALAAVALGMAEYRKLWAKREATRAELALATAKADAERRLRLATEGADVGVWHWDAKADRLEWSPQCRNHLALPPDAKESFSHFYSVMHPEDRPQVQEALDKALRDHGDFYVEFRTLSPDGSTRWIGMPGQAYRHPDGSVSATAGVTVDITPRKEAEQALRRLTANLEQQVQERTAEAVKAHNEAESERLKLAAVIDSLLDVHVLLRAVRDERGRIVDFLHAEVNEAACRHHHCTPGELIGRSLTQALPPQLVEEIFPVFCAVIETGQPLVQDDFCYPDDDPEKVRWFDLRAVKLGELLSLTARDVTERHHTAQKLTASEERYRLLALNSSDVVVRTDLDGAMRWVSPSLKAALGWNPRDWVGRAMPEVLAGKADRTAFAALQGPVREGRSEILRARLPAKDGSSHWAELHAGPYLDRDGKIDGIIVSFHLIDAEVQGEQERQRQQQIITNERKHLADVIEGSDTGTWEWSVQTGKTVFNEVWAKIIGYRLEELEPVSIDTWIKYVHPDDLAKSNELLQRCFRRECEVYECEARMRHRNGEWVWVLDRGRVVEWDEEGKPVRMLGSHRDITANVKLRQELERQATTDPLTGLCNRRQFEVHAHRELSRAQRSGEPFSVVVLDIDKFKPINDNNGHEAGDAVLKSLARACAPHLREIDTLARMGGEEFAVLLPETRLAAAQHVAERLREALADQRVATPAGEVRFTVSLGVAEHESKREDLATLLRRADQALYSAKNAGRNRVCTG